WFEVHGGAQFNGQMVALPELLHALKSGQDFVSLDDGTLGVLPQEWLAKYGLLADLGASQEGHLRFARSQVVLLDALLASRPEASFDAVFEQARDRLHRFDGIRPAPQPEGFIGELRGYQREGLGWMHFLREFGFGGCLADDMGLGKTVQVLALLQERRRLPDGQSGNGAGAEAPSADRPLPSLVVVPRSIVYNWQQEAARFAPQLRVLNHTGPKRSQDASAFAGHDLVITTYGILRRDAAFLAEAQFDYVILDEAQTIKNPKTASAKAARLLPAKHRLALSGTPIENHIGELFSIFEFLNPGMLGNGSGLAGRLAGAGRADPETQQVMAQALRPFILRRTKQQVAPDLPTKTEQTLFCELGTKQRRLYNQLRDYYRQSLLKKIEADGLNRSKIMVLEALLRLRQAACHPALLDSKKGSAPSAKLDQLMSQLAQVLAEGHKALVFSQFTSFLALVRQRLESEGIYCYEYLDGRIRKRAPRVERFQNDPSCKLFLISLKAGGLGLNLTAADYVFLLDPWWNPAVEAQAIDRAHRIGQTRQVFAYRLIARDTVEEKILELQQSKRDLAEAIITRDNSLIRNLRPEDLALLLS
ncbi:MAG: DEAD/DEAH box helicase, partial [Acidobacteriota bacterium]